MTPLRSAPIAHWDAVWAATKPDAVSWYQDVPSESLELITRHVAAGASVIDVGGGASTLADGLLDIGFDDVTVLDLSSEAISHSRLRLAGRADAVTWIVADVTTWLSERTWDLWHDRAALHFLTEDDQVARYVSIAAQAISPGGHLIVSTFGPDGPMQCSGLPVRRWSAATLTAHFAASFEPIDATTSIHTTPRRTRQQFVTLTFVRREEGTRSHESRVTGSGEPSRHIPPRRV